MDSMNEVEKKIIKILEEHKDSKTVGYYTVIVRELSSLIQEERQGAVREIHRAVIDTIFRVNERQSKDDVGEFGYAYDKATNKALSELNKLLSFTETFLSLEDKDKEGHE